MQKEYELQMRNIIDAAQKHKIGRRSDQNQQQVVFQLLQHQMQTSQPFQQDQMSVNIGDQGGQPTGPNQQMLEMPSGQGRQQIGITNDASNLTLHDRRKIMELAQRMADACPEPQKICYRNIVQTRFAPRAQEYTAKGKDPVLIWFQHKAFQHLSAAARDKQQLEGVPPKMPPTHA